MLGDQDAAVGDELGGAFLLKGRIVPGVGEGDFHGGGGADVADAEEEGGVTGLHFGIGVSADVADLGLVCGDGAGLDHLVELQARGDTAEEAAFIDGGKAVVVVGKTRGVGLGAGGVAELDLGVLLGDLDEEGLMAEGIGEDEVAALVDELLGGVSAFLTLGDTGLEQVLNAQLLAGFLGRVDEVEVVGGVLVMQEDEAGLDRGLGGGGGSGDSGESEDHGQSNEQRKDLFHVQSPCKKFSGLRPVDLGKWRRHEKSTQILSWQRRRENKKGTGADDRRPVPMQTIPKGSIARPCWVLR